MRKVIVTFLLLAITGNIKAQSTFKCGWTTFKTAAIVHEYTYSYNYTDSFKLYLADSTKTFIAPDSAATLTVDYPFHDNVKYQVANFYNARKKVIKTEEYKDNIVQVLREFKYDDKNRKIYEYEDNKLNGNNFKKNFDFTTDKSTGDAVIQETAYFNGRVEFYTKSYFDKSNQRYKEIRLNDNNKDVVHVENFYYNTAGKLKERTVYFPEFKVTKKFTEPGGDVPVKCYKSQMMNIPDKAAINTKVSFLKKLLTKNMSTLFDKDCNEFEYKFHNADCEVIISTIKVNNVKQVIFRFKEKLPA